MKKIVLTFGFLALFGSLLVSCSKDREEVSFTKGTNDAKQDDKDDNSLTKENLAKSGTFTLMRIRHIVNGKETIEKVYLTTEYTFKSNGEYVRGFGLSTSNSSDDMGKYELSDNTINIKKEDGEDDKYEVVEFIKGKSLKLKKETEYYGLNGIEKPVYISEYEVKK